jgi:site-specific recombinase XerC
VPHAMLHSLATYLAEDDYDLRTIHELLRHAHYKGMRTRAVYHPKVIRLIIWMPVASAWA